VITRSAIEEVGAGIAVTIYAFTSRNEGFGLTLIEAMSVGAALVASPAGARRTGDRGRTTGVLCRRVTSRADGVLEPLMRDSRRGPRRWAPRRAAAWVAQFSLDARSRGICGLYSTLV